MCYIICINFVYSFWSLYQLNEFISNKRMYKLNEFVVILYGCSELMEFYTSRRFPEVVWKMERDFYGIIKYIKCSVFRWLSSKCN